MIIFFVCFVFRCCSKAEKNIPQSSVPATPAVMSSRADSIIDAESIDDTSNASQPQQNLTLLNRSLKYDEEATRQKQIIGETPAPSIGNCSNHDYESLVFSRSNNSDQQGQIIQICSKEIKQLLS